MTMVIPLLFFFSFFNHTDTIRGGGDGGGGIAKVGHISESLRSHDII